MNSFNNTCSFESQKPYFLHVGC